MCCFLSNRITGRSLISTPFYLGVAAEDIYQDQHVEILPKISIYRPSEQNIFLFEIAHQVDILKEAVGLVLESLEVASSEAILGEAILGWRSFPLRDPEDGVIKADWV